MARDFQFDVFLSHNRADKPRVRRLAERLKGAGLRVWLDEWVIQPGDIISLKVDEGLEQSRVLLLCLSPAALASDWVALERSTAIHRDPANAGRRFIPLLLADCELPDTLRRYKYVDYREEAEGAFAELIDALEKDSILISAGSNGAASEPIVSSLNGLKHFEHKFEIGDAASVVVSRDGTLAVLHEGGTTISLLNAQDYSLLVTINLMGVTSRISFSPSGKTVIAAYSGRIYIWETLSGKSRGILAYQNTFINSCEPLSDNKILCGSKNGFISIWDVDTRHYDLSRKSYAGHT